MAGNRHLFKLPAVLFAMSLVLVLPGVGASASVGDMWEYSVSGVFVSDANPGSDPFWEQLEGGSFEGTYWLTPGTLPAESGTSFGIDSFDIVLMAPDGSEVLGYRSPGDFAGFFADFFGPGSGDGFVFNDGSTQFQIGYPSAFDGTARLRDGGVFAASDAAPPGGIAVLEGSAKLLCTITGTLGDDRLSGTPGPDVICGLAGDDVIHGFAGDDRLLGGPGDDRLYGGEGDDSLRGNGGDDRLHGGPGMDVLLGLKGNDVLGGNAGDDRLEGNRGNDRLYGGPGDDALFGGVGIDLCRGGTGSDTTAQCE